MRLAALALLIASAGCSSSNAPAIADMAITGNHALSDADLRAYAAACADLEDCRGSLGQKYLEEGYLSAAVTAERSPLQRFLGTKGGTLNVTEGPRYTIGTVAFTETGGPFADGLGDAAALEALGSVRAGSAFRVEDLNALFAAIQRRYAAAGFGRTTVLPVTDIDTDAHSVSLTVEIDRGAGAPTPLPPP